MSFFNHIWSNAIVSRLGISVIVLLWCSVFTGKKVIDRNVVFVFNGKNDSARTS